MTRPSRYKLFIWIMIFSGVVLVVTLTITSTKIISGGKHFSQKILDEHRILLLSTLGFGHGVMTHMGATNYDDLITLALECESIRYLAILDRDGRIIVQSALPKGFHSLNRDTFLSLKDNEILERTKDIFLVSYKLKNAGAKPNMKSGNQHMAAMGKMQSHTKPEWFLVGIDTSVIRKHYNDMIFQTVGTGGLILLFGVLIIIFLGIVQRYELAHRSIEKLHKIKRVLGHFVPQTAKNIIEKEPDKKGLLSKYIEDATILFLDIEGFTLLLQKYSQERINRDIESYFSTFFTVIHKNMGDINETAGDGMMVIFLDPDPEQHAKNAVQAALDIREVCPKVSKNKASDLFPVQVNIGINSGEAYLGSTKMSSNEGERWTFTASGEVTIRAARLSQHARKGQILISEETAKRIGSTFSLKPLGKVPLKNLRDSGDVYEVSPIDAT